MGMLQKLSRAVLAVAVPACWSSFDIVERSSSALHGAVSLNSL